MPNETPLECPDCEGHGELAFYNPETQDYGPTVTCDACEGSGERRCEASPHRCDDAAVAEYECGSRGILDRYAFCAACLAIAKEYDRGELDPPDRDDLCERRGVHDTTPCPAPDFGATG